MGGKIQMFTTSCWIFTIIHPRFLHPFNLNYGQLGYRDSTLGGVKTSSILVKTEHAQRKLLYFVNRHNAESTKIGPKMICQLSLAYLSLYFWYPIFLNETQFQKNSDIIFIKNLSLKFQFYTF